MPRFTSHPFGAGITRRTVLCAATATLLPRTAYLLSAHSAHEQHALNAALEDTPARAIVLHQQTGRILATYGDTASLSTPGSILKPLLLSTALQQNLISPTTTVFCRRDLRIDNQPYPCTHPHSNTPFNAQEALAYSCNTWFASLALRYTTSRLVETLNAFHFYHVTSPESPEQKQLLALGLAGITTSPEEIATAYRILAGQFQLPFEKPVADGLHDSVSFGMAHSADAPGFDISGKTGTASNLPRQPWSHGWFAGLATIHRVPLVISLYLPQGNGADAAHLARTFFLACNKATV